MKTILFLLFAGIILFSQNVSTLYAQQSGVWECYPNDCRIPRRNYANLRQSELDEDAKFKNKVEKTLAREPKKFQQLDRQNKNQLETQRTRRRYFSAWAFPLQYN